jgi:predicted N-acyltransferase
MPDFKYQVLNSITQINEKEWDNSFGDIPEGYNFYKTLEDSHLQDFTFYYMVLRQGQEIVLIAPLFVTDFNLDIGVEGWLKSAIEGVRKVFPRFLVLKTLFCGSVFGEHGAVGIKNDVDKELVMHEFNRALGEFCKDKEIPFVIFKDFLSEDTPLLDGLLKKGFFKVNSFPSVVTDINFSSFDEYLDTLSYATRKNIRRRMKKAYASTDITIKITDNVDDMIEDVFRLYEDTYRSGSTKFERLSREFFTKVARNMRPKVKFFLYYCDGKLGAFNLCFCHNDLLIDKFIGFNYDISRKYSLYFLTWCYNIEWCLENKMRCYQTGQTDYHPKVRLGGRLVPLYAYLRHRNPVMNTLLKALAVLLKPENFDRDIKGRRDAAEKTDH